MRKIKLDIIIAPGYDDDALELLQKKKGTRILALPNRTGERIAELDVRPISGGMLVQEPDIEAEDPAGWKVVTDKQPTEQEMADLEFAWRVMPLIKSLHAPTPAAFFVRIRKVCSVLATRPLFVYATPVTGTTVPSISRS